MNSEWSCDHAQALCRPKLDHIPARRGDFFIQFHAKPRSNCQLLGEEGSVFSKSVAPDKSIMFQWKATYTRIFEQHKLALMGEKDTKLVGREGCWIQEELEEGG